MIFVFLVRLKEHLITAIVTGLGLRELGGLEGLRRLGGGLEEIDRTEYRCGW